VRRKRRTGFTLIAAFTRGLYCCQLTLSRQLLVIASVDGVRATAGLRPLYFVRVTMAEHQIEIAFPSSSVHQLIGTLENHDRGQRYL
jgi:hypothetical protein